jgi:hypothetical protein
MNRFILNEEGCNIAIKSVALDQYLQRLKKHHYVPNGNFKLKADHRRELLITV